MQIFGFDPRSPDAYSKDPATNPDPRTMPDLIALPARHKGLGLRRMDDAAGAAAFFGGWDLATPSPEPMKKETDTKAPTRSLSLLSAQICKTRRMRYPLLRLNRLPLTDWQTVRRGI